MMKPASEHLTRAASVGRAAPTVRKTGAKRARGLAWVATLSLLLLSAACGQKGPLTLPRSATAATSANPAALKAPPAPTPSRPASAVAL
ncbi:LPS translocon maturation chaperone LptM [Roseateles sp.]|uniref:LPS translocon maturation chaperone LptM n=1 Tax=Roseateles sp. TaxID=1971397 RepID=UPI003BA42EB7